MKVSAFLTALSFENVWLHPEGPRTQCYPLKHFFIYEEASPLRQNIIHATLQY